MSEASCVVASVTEQSIGREFQSGGGLSPGKTNCESSLIMNCIIKYALYSIKIGSGRPFLLAYCIC